MERFLFTLLVIFIISLPAESQQIFNKINSNPDQLQNHSYKTDDLTYAAISGNIGLTTQIDYCANSIYKNSINHLNFPLLISLVEPYSTFPPTERHLVLSEEITSGNFIHHSVFGFPSGINPSMDIKLSGNQQGLLGIAAHPNNFALRADSNSFIVKSLPGSNPGFVFSNDNIYLVSSEQSEHYLYISNDLGNNFQLIDSIAKYHPSPIFGITQGEVEIFKSPNEQHIVLLGTNSGNGNVYNGIPENQADNVWIIYSNDFGNNWTGKTIGVDGKPNLVDGYHSENFAPLFENFGQLSGTVTNDGVIHIAANGYGVVLDSLTGSSVIASSFPLLYWNSVGENWRSVSDISVDTVQAIGDYFPPNSIGQAYPSIAVSEDGEIIYVVWTGPQFLSEGQLDIADNGTGNLHYWRDLYHALSSDGGLTWLTGNPIPDMNSNLSEIYGQVSKTLELHSQTIYRAHLKYIIDQNSGVSPFDGIITENPIVYNFFDITFTSLNEPEIFRSFELLQNYPNPFNPSTVIKYQIPNAGLVSLRVYDLLGREVAALVDELKAAGNYEVEFDASSLSSGVYFYQLKAGEYSKTNKMILIR